LRIIVVIIKKIRKTRLPRKGRISTSFRHYYTKYPPLFLYNFKLYTNYHS
jgi:hypothetical protein